MQINNNKTQIKSWDNSDQLKDYAKGFTLKLRTIAQIAGFIILPGYLSLLYHLTLKFDNWQVCFQSILLLLIISLIVYLIMKGYKLRKTTGQVYETFKE
jgi:hypothetical protein